MTRVIFVEGSDYVGKDYFIERCIKHHHQLGETTAELSALTEKYRPLVIDEYSKENPDLCKILNLFLDSRNELINDLKETIEANLVDYIYVNRWSVSTWVQNIIEPNIGSNFKWFLATTAIDDRLGKFADLATFVIAFVHADISVVEKRMQERSKTDVIDPKSKEHALRRLRLYKSAAENMLAHHKCRDLLITKGDTSGGTVIKYFSNVLIGINSGDDIEEFLREAFNV